MNDLKLNRMEWHLNKRGLIQPDQVFYHSFGLLSAWNVFIYEESHCEAERRRLHPREEQLVFWCVQVGGRRGVSHNSASPAAAEHGWQTGAAATRPARASKGAFLVWTARVRPGLTSTSHWESEAVLCLCMLLPYLQWMQTWKKTDFYLCPGLSRLTFLIQIRAL